MMSEAFSNWKLHFLFRERKCARSNAPVTGSGSWGEWWAACRNQRSQAGWPLPHPTNQHADQVPSLRWGFWYLKCPMPCGHDSHESFLPHGSPWPGRAGQGALPKGAVTQTAIPSTPPPHSEPLVPSPLFLVLLCSCSSHQDMCPYTTTGLP